MFRKYLVNIHKFYNHFYAGEMDSPIMPPLIFGVTLTSFLAAIDIAFNNRHWIEWLTSSHKIMITAPGFTVMFVTYMWYRSRLPSSSELMNKKGMWLGIILSMIAILSALIASGINP
ncbi:MAG: hypothetical protein ACRBG0_16680 [Lewinella sp.]|uniref:hypothetical protein n=1 Tax=Lewinella sp. TaxID=2004506 RepID=UPI003D6AFC02